MASINVSLPQVLKQFAEQRVSSGHYSTVSDYVRDLIRRDQMTREEKLADLRREIQIGIDQADRGETVPLDMEEIRREGRRLLAQSKERQGEAINGAR